MRKDAWLAGAALLAAWLTTAALANPVPEGPADAGRERSSRGHPELRDPPGGVVSLSVLLRSCVRCHGVRGPSHVLFDSDGRLLSVLDRKWLVWGINDHLWWGDRHVRGDDRKNVSRALRLLQGGFR